jgi:TRAP-type mannitol/chloroaromatic compound transport system substrate-binding protein
VDEHGVQLRRLPDDVLLELWRASEVVMQELIAKDPMAARVYASYKEFLDGVRAYHHISEQAYTNARDMVLDSDAR